MRIMVVGAGGREHAIIRKIAQNKKVGKIFALPGNGGIAADAECVPIDAADIGGITAFAVKERVDFAVVAPDDPLVAGAVDELSAAGIPCFGPDKKAAIIEGSKIFAKDLMKKYGIPTAGYATFDSVDAADAYIDNADAPIVVKADGLALGKGVIIAQTREEAKKAVHDMMEGGLFGGSGKRVVIEEYLEGPEVSVLAFTDGKTIKPMVSSMDHKRALDGDRGLNTGGMGTIAPNPYYTEEIAARCTEEIFVPTVRAMNAEGRTFRGCLYFGLMLTDRGPKVIEYNCRFGDPEAQVVLPLLESDLLEIMIAVHNGTLEQTEVKFSGGHACCVIAASKGYPEKYEKGFEITLPDYRAPGTEIYFAGAKLSDGKLVTSGGRVLGAVSTGGTLEAAVSGAYGLIKTISFENMFYRNDIGGRALKAVKTR
ncbi:MAG: phosphoribosylamine--glycine ligase [Clostridiales bacterium]|nr:phosphoribosylamine--glycine ligase [Clostridiales bacterium]